jgi:hypothetical protein
MSSDDTKAYIERATRALEEWGTVAPLKRSRYWVRLGSKDDAGEFTREFGGDGAPHPDSVLATFEPGAEPSDRLVWFLRHTDELVLEGQTARGITGAPDVRRLVEVVRDAVKADLVERWTDQGGPPAHLDPEIHQFRLVGVRLTEKGKARARELEQIHDPERVWPAGTRA